MNTKEQNKYFVAVIAFSSVGANYVGAHRYQTCIIGNLPKEEAREFWQQLHQNVKESTELKLMLRRFMSSTGTSFL